mmetsp:Transcript_17535/g.50059  ORF Transcript_17535/g.50059 Transcript_17535/m.50059 type:complete len:369 (-) Transcript_17535:322-1428(-)
MSPSPARQSLPKALASCWVEVTWEGPWSASMTTLRDAENNRECCGSASDRRAASRKWSNAKTCATHLLRSSSPSCFPYTPPSFPFLPRLSSSLANAVSASPNKWSASWALRDPSPRNGRAASSAAFSHGASIDAKSPSTCARRTWSHRTSSSGLNTKRFAATSSTTFLRASTKLSLRQTAAQRRRRSLFCAVANSAFGAVDLFDEAPTNNSSSHALREASSGTVVSRTASEARLAATARARSSNRRSTPRRTWPAGRGVAFFGGGGGGSTHLPSTVALRRLFPSNLNATAPLKPPGRSGRHVSAQAATSPRSIVIDWAPPSKRAVMFVGVRTTSTVALRFASAGQLNTNVLTASLSGCCSPKSMVAGL